MNKKGCLAFSALAFSMLLASCGPSDKPSGDGGNKHPEVEEVLKKVEIPADFVFNKTKSKVWNTTYGTDPKTFNPYRSNFATDSQHTTNFMEGLVENDKYGHLVPALAESIPEPVINKDTGEASYTFKIKDGMIWSKWENGQLVKAADIKASDFVTSAKHSLGPKGVYVSYLYHLFIKGSAEYSEMKAAAINEDGKVDKDKDAAAEKFFNENVGVKADDAKNEVTFILPKPMDYFPTVLTYCCFYPAPTELMNKDPKAFTVAADAEQHMWYSGAFALKKFIPGNSFEYAKNTNYWDKDNVALDTINMKLADQAAGPSYGRTLYESKTVDSFTVNEKDEMGYKKYVTGEDGSHKIGDPINNLANALYATPETTTFYLGYNFHRKLMENTDLQEAQIRNFEKAIENTNFRKAILYATDKGTYNMRNTPNNPNKWTANGYTVGSLAADSKDKDYTDYVIDQFADHNDMTFDEAKKVVGAGKPGVLNAAAAKGYLDLALSELGDTVTLPINFEIVEQQNDDMTPFYNEFMNSLQNNLDPSGEKVKVSIKQLNATAMDNAFYYQDYSVSGYFGWAADYGDPLSFLGTVAIGGDLTPNFGIVNDAVKENKILGTYTNLLNYAKTIDDKDDRLVAYAQAEYYLLYEQALIIPLTQRNQGIAVTVTKVAPKTAQRAAYGTGRDKLKGTVVYTEPLNKVEFAYLVDQYEKGASK